MPPERDEVSAHEAPSRLCWKIDERRRVGGEPHAPGAAVTESSGKRVALVSRSARVRPAESPEYAVLAGYAGS